VNGCGDPVGSWAFNRRPVLAGLLLGLGAILCFATLFLILRARLSAR